MTIFSSRLKNARQIAGLSQERLGFRIGFDEGSARSRMNHYETGKHAPDYSVVERLADALMVPEAYFYEKDDDIAELLVKLHQIKLTERKKVVEFFLQHINSIGDVSSSQ